jgi:SAM-dependent methyltransferase
MTAPLSIEQAAYFDRLAEVESAHWWSLAMWRVAGHWLTSALRGRSRLDALDVGCGAGATTLRLARRSEIAAVVGLDPSPDALAHARARLGVPLVRGSALALPFGDARFDVATCFDVLQHLPVGGDRRAAAELRRVLRPGGVVVVRANARRKAQPRAGEWSGYRPEELVALFEEAGFDVPRATLVNCLPALAEELRSRWARAGRELGAGGHPAGRGLRIQMPHPAVNRLMRVVSAAEASVAGRLPARLPYGHSTMILARRLA